MTTVYLTPDQLLAATLEERDVEISLGTVRVRGLSREESVPIQQVDGAEREALIISLAMVAPPMSVEQVQAMAKVLAAGDFDKLSRAVGELSHLLEASDKETYKSV